MRITSSKRAHQVKTRQTNFEKLASQFLKEKFDGRLIPSIKYGIDMEHEAKIYFSQTTAYKIASAGLVVKINQPFLAASPDGIIFEKNALLEIKCPYTCKNDIIVDREAKVSKVS